MKEETAQRIANALEALVMIVQALVSNEPAADQPGGPLTVMTQDGPVTIKR